MSEGEREVSTSNEALAVYAREIMRLEKELAEARKVFKTCPTCGANYDAKKIGCGYCEAEIMMASLAETKVKVGRSYGLEDEAIELTRAVA